MGMVGSNGNPYKRPLRNSIGKSLIEGTTGDYQETFEETKTVESKTESGTITPNATNETKYVKPICHTGYVFEIEDTLVVASSMANAITLYCEKKNRREDYIKNVKRIGCGKEGNFGTSVNYEAIIEG